MKLIPTQTALAASASISSPLRDNVIERITSADFRLDVTSAALVVGDTLAVFIQHRPAGTAIAWHDFVSFTVVLGNGGAVAEKASWNRQQNPDVEVEAPAAEALAAGTVQQGPVENEWRVRAVIAGATPVFTFDVYADPVVSSPR